MERAHEMAKMYVERGAKEIKLKVVKKNESIQVGP
jgi:hypothetical protein